MNIRKEKTERMGVWGGIILKDIMVENFLKLLTYIFRWENFNEL